MYIYIIVLNWSLAQCWMSMAEWFLPVPLQQDLWHVVTQWWAFHIPWDLGGGTSQSSIPRHGPAWIQIRSTIGALDLSQCPGSPIQVGAHLTPEWTAEAPGFRWQWCCVSSSSWVGLSLVITYCVAMVFNRFQYRFFKRHEWLAVTYDDLRNDAALAEFAWL